MHTCQSGSRGRKRVRRRRDPAPAAWTSRRRDRRADGRLAPVPPLGAQHPHLVPLADRVIEADHRRDAGGHDVVFLALPHGASAPLAEPTARHRGRDRLRRRLPAHRRRRVGALLRRPARRCWPYGLPELPGQREALDGAAPDRRPGLLPDRLDAGPCARGSRRPGRPGRHRHRRRLGHVRRRQGSQAAPARRRR